MREISMALAMVDDPIRHVLCDSGQLGQSFGVSSVDINEVCHSGLPR